MTGRKSTKAKGAPDYDDAKFWNARFATGSEVNEWLNSGEAILEAVLSDLSNRPRVTTSRVPRVLHLGPGMSKLGCTLRDECVEREWQGNGIVVRSPQFIHLYSTDWHYRMPISQPKPFAWAVMPKVPRAPCTQCIGYVLTCVCGMRSPC